MPALCGAKSTGPTKNCEEEGSATWRKSGRRVHAGWPASYPIFKDCILPGRESNSVSLSLRNCQNNLEKIDGKKEDGSILWGMKRGNLESLTCMLTFGIYFLQACLRGETKARAFLSGSLLGELAAVESIMMERAASRVMADSTARSITSQDQQIIQASIPPELPSNYMDSKVNPDHTCSICLVCFCGTSACIEALYAEC